MKYNVKVGEKTFEVEIEDINQRPIIARVDGEEFEVRPENGIKAPVRMVDPSQPVPSPLAGAATSVNLPSKTLLSPLPGVVTEVFVKPGEVVESGTTVLVIEAMKMKNSIRSIRSGKVAQVLVNAGQTVSHKQPLVEFEA